MSNIGAAGGSGLDTLSFMKPNAANISPDLILPPGQDIEVAILRERISQLPRELLRDKHIIQECRSASLDEKGEICVEANLEFWKSFVKDDIGLETFNANKKRLIKSKADEQEQHWRSKEAFRCRLDERVAPLTSQESLLHQQLQREYKRDLTARSAPLRKAGEGKPFSNEHSALEKRPLQQPQQQKRPRLDPVPEEFLPYAVYVEKFDETEAQVKMIGKEFDTIKAHIANAFWLESPAFKDKLKNDIDRRLFSSERGTATFFAKSECAQAFIIEVINGRVKLPGIKARGPREESKPNLDVNFPAAVDKMQPELLLNQLLQMHANVDCEPVVRNIRPWGHGRTVSVELPADKLAQLAAWALDNNVDSFLFFAEKLHFWPTTNTSSTKPSLPLSTVTTATVVNRGCSW